MHKTFTGQLNNVTWMEEGLLRDCLESMGGDREFVFQGVGTGS